MKITRLNELLLDSIPHAAMLVCKDRAVLAANRMAREIGVIVGCYCRQNFGQSKFIPDDHNSECEIKDKAGKTHILLVSVKHVSIKDGTMLYTCRDMTELKQTQQALLWESGVKAAIAQLPDSLISPTSIEEISCIVLEHAKQLTSSEHGYVGYIDPDTGHLVSPTLTRDIWDVCQVKDKGIVFKHFAGLWGWVLNNNKSLMTNDPSTDPRSTGIPAGDVPICRFIAVPALIGGTLVGQIALANSDRDYTEQDLKLLERVATLYAIAVQRKQTEKALQKAHDGLEQRVEERTGELARVNEQLKLEIVERKQAEDALRESEERYRTVLETNPDPVVVYDNEGKVTYFNPAFTRVFGWTLEERLGKKLDIFVPEENWPETKMMINKTLAAESFSGIESRRSTKEGNIISVSISAAGYRDRNGKHKGSVVNLRNITEQKKLEAQLRQAQKMEAVGTLAGGIAHDFNNLLQVIAGFTQVLLEEKDRSDPDYKRLQIIDQSAKEAGDLINQLLIFSRKVESKLRPVALNRKVEQVSKLLGRTIPKMIGIELHPAEDLKIINADTTQIEQILMNLGVNAKDAMPDGGKLIFETENVILDEQFCQTHPGAGPGEYVLLSVSDTGCGMDPDTLEHIFEPFYTTKKTGKGTGLGLAMVYGIVKSHGGYITCHSWFGQGTTFKIYFPVLKTESPRQKAKPKKEVLPGGQETILLVDDEAAILETGKAMLEHYGYTTISAESGERAIEIFEREKGHIDLVILDVGMPGMGGHKCLRHLLKIDPGVKVIIASGYTAAGKVKETLESGAAEFIKKPYRLADISKKVREVLDKK